MIVNEEIQEDAVLTLAQADPFRKMLPNPRCDCGQDLTRQPISRYPHGAGWTVKDMRVKQWLYIICPKCKYQNALWKLGVPRQ